MWNLYNVQCGKWGGGRKSPTRSVSSVVTLSDITVTVAWPHDDSSPPSWPLPPTFFLQQALHRVNKPLRHNILLPIPEVFQERFHIWWSHSFGHCLASVNTVSIVFHSYFIIFSPNLTGRISKEGSKGKVQTREVRFHNFFKRLLCWHSKRFSLKKI